MKLGTQLRRKRIRVTAQGLEFLFPCCVDVIWEKVRTSPRPELSHWGNVTIVPGPARAHACGSIWSPLPRVLCEVGFPGMQQTEHLAMLGVACISVGIWTCPKSPDGAPGVCARMCCEDCSSCRPVLISKFTVKSHRQVRGVGTEGELLRSLPGATCNPSSWEAGGSRVEGQSNWKDG